MHHLFSRHLCGVHLHPGRHHRGFRGFGFGPGQLFGRDPGQGGMGAGRKLSSADLQLLILSLLVEKPRHGYEIIKALAERSNGYYSPSPGMVYPALTYLEEIGHATFAVEGTRKLYSVTPDGIAYVEANRATVDTLLEQLAWIGQRMAQVRQAFTPGGPDAGADEDFDAPQHQRRAGARGRAHDFMIEIRQARRNLKSALIAKFGASLDEQRRIADVLERAAREIRGD